MCRCLGIGKLIMFTTTGMGLRPHAEAKKSRPKVSESRRRRISRACNACKSRKSKCTGGHPCTSCREKDFECRYRPQHGQMAPAPVQQAPAPVPQPPAPQNQSITPLGSPSTWLSETRPDPDPSLLDDIITQWLDSPSAQPQFDGPSQQRQSFDGYPLQTQSFDGYPPQLQSFSDYPPPMQSFNGPPRQSQFDGYPPPTPSFTGPFPYSQVFDYVSPQSQTFNYPSLQPESFNGSPLQPEMATQSRYYYPSTQQRLDSWSVPRSSGLPPIEHSDPSGQGNGAMLQTPVAQYN
ncbi:hypothetical protein GMORB2_2164 [Geosmithia morbida]|uniref:Zn(2)-C6 fungal-type domain-containing protein n=1 Tax=Geosmithia morbida TaxID=1094350 RepID=A0A9P5D039_9HYPO|nr:uncharacterized protein GMORB2_2164 [Geosmithia morbida]KAF4121202.1 hypothetical protein GMORB2_2164 [Geosmithia morbida]